MILVDLSTHEYMNTGRCSHVVLLSFAHGMIFRILNFRIYMATLIYINNAHRVILYIYFTLSRIFVPIVSSDSMMALANHVKS